ncbi:MAG: tetratricopeptide repeat protein, partial [Hyphomonadaceae bacterium]
DLGAGGSCVTLGLSYKFGKGTAVDQVRSSKLYERACHLKEFQGCTFLGRNYQTGEGVAQDFTRANALFKLSCNGGDLGGCTALGTSYLRGIGTPADIHEAAVLLNGACDRGNMLGCHRLAIILEGSPDQVDRAAQLHKEACDNLEAEACAWLGRLYFFGRGVAKDTDAGVSLIRRGLKLLPSNELVKSISEETGIN